MSDIGTAPDAEAIAENRVPAVHELARLLCQAQEPVLPRLPLGLRASVAIRTACLGWAVKRLAYPVLFAACACYEDTAR